MASILVEKIDVESNVRTINGVDVSKFTFDELPDEERESIIELANGIKDQGLIQAISVKTKKEGRYRLVTGWRRLMAHRYLEARNISALVLKGKKEDEPVLQLIENVQRVGLNAMDIARSLDQIRTIKGIKKQEQLAKTVGKSPAWVSQHLSLLTTDESVQEAVEDGTIGVGGARELSTLPKGEQKEALDDAKKEAQEAAEQKGKKGKKVTVKTKGARRQAKKRKNKKEKSQQVIRPVQEREQEQKKEVLLQFIDYEFGEREASDHEKELLLNFWDFLFDNNRLVIKP